MPTMVMVDSYYIFKCPRCRRRLRSDTPQDIECPSCAEDSVPVDEIEREKAHAGLFDRTEAETHA